MLCSSSAIRCGAGAAHHVDGGARVELEELRANFVLLQQRVLPSECGGLMRM